MVHDWRYDQVPGDGHSTLNIIKFQSDRSFKFLRTPDTMAGSGSLRTSRVGGYVKANKFGCRFNQVGKMQNKEGNSIMKRSKGGSFAF